MIMDVYHQVLTNHVHVQCIYVLQILGKGLRPYIYMYVIAWSMTCTHMCCYNVHCTLYIVRAHDCICVYIHVYEYMHTV